ncbi:5'-methylthioadenosine/S-adenosylhomocysteine nucleosidase [Williamsoniiplasma somnilux]|uniref:adenosylhomocysteine nucleosidase n=1 Tax=Williamsoniiplasma somnilux TaxID=215578 RepID=A0A2K8NY96_9MOLU|nr:5'-methylthioadenosine/S-adenosylhomocysteine nucleosidase [Williamsoniiplasma somnilux]ATZ18714.1 5'-methylthioadenosine/S-adenosylhomocysteine nucleosidase [Williamsoniiplasma somnilux]
MKIIIGAMEEELEPLKKALNLKPVINSLIQEYISNDKEVLVAWTGIGQVNAATGLTYLLTKYGQAVEYVLNVGTAGAINKDFKRGDLLFIEKASYSSADVTGFGYVYGQIPRMPKYFLGTEDLIATIGYKLEQVNQTFFLANTATSDRFFSNYEQVQKYASKLPFTAHIVEMECAAYYQVAYLFDISIVAIKIVSDVIGLENSNEEQFDEFLPKVAQKLNELVQLILK